LRRARTTWRDWLYLVANVVLVAAVELTDDFAHALVPRTNDPSLGMANALHVANFEAAHDLWIEPAIQSFFARTHTYLGVTIDWSIVTKVVDALYGQGHVFFTLGFAIWVFLRRRALFSFLRNIFLLTNTFAVLLYESFPLAPPRLASGLRYDGHPYHFLDAVFGGANGLKIGFNQYAAMPSVHVAWALIVGLTMAWVTKPVLLRLLALCYPVIMIMVVIITGNHYILDALGAVGVVLTSTVLVTLYTWWRQGGESLGAVVGHLHALRLPDAPYTAV
jgi:hypothetical protein